MQRKDIFCVKQNINIMFAFTTGQGRHETTLIGGGGFIESPEYAIFIKLPEFSRFLKNFWGCKLYRYLLPVTTTLPATLHQIFHQTYKHILLGP